MEAEEFSQGNVSYYAPFQGCICESSKEPRAGFEEKEYFLSDNVTKRTKYVKKYKSLSGFISKVEYVSKEFEGKKIKQWKITLKDSSSDEVMVFQFGVATNVARCWSKITPNIDLSLEVTICCWPDKQNKDMTVLCVKQNNEMLKFAYTRETPNGLPQPKRRPNGEYDWTEQEDFLYEKNLEFVQKVENSNFQPQAPSPLSTRVSENIPQHEMFEGAKSAIENPPVKTPQPLAPSADDDLPF